MSIPRKRAYEAPAPSDGCRILVDRLWLRGLCKDHAKRVAQLTARGSRAAHRLATRLIPVACLAAATVPAQVSFTHRTIDAALHGDCKALGDFDGDGLLDVAIGGAAGLRLYRAPGWTAVTIALPRAEFTTDMQAADVDGDGDSDLVVPDYGTDILWFENPRPSGDPWTATWRRHVIGAFGWAHDVEVGDVDRDAQLDVVTRQDGTTLWLQTAADVWRRVDIAGASPGGEGADLGDIDRDGDLDLALNGYWMECPDDPGDGAAWVKHGIVAGWPDLCGVRVTEVDDDGRPDVILAASESTGRLSWFRGPLDPRAATAWSETVIDPSVDYVHTFQVLQVDGNGWPDIVFAEMAQSDLKRVGVFYNDGAGASYTLQVLATTGSHNVRAGDLGADGDVDVVGANWQGPPVEWWESGGCDGEPAPADQGNVLRAVARPPDVALEFPGAPGAAWRVDRDRDRRVARATPLTPDAALPRFTDPGELARAEDAYYRVRGVAPCGRAGR